MNLWFWSLVMLGCISLGITIESHGKITERNAWLSFLALILQIILVGMAIRHGGF